jgi:uncharacterized SAM-binding protein YcdF (DUF218 family)
MGSTRGGMIVLTIMGWLIFSVLVVWSGTVALILAAGARPVIRDADAILVLGAAQYNGRPSPVFRARLDHAIALYKQQLAPKIVFTGGVGVGDTLSEGEVARRYALKNGVPEAAILVERRGVTSAESITAAATLLRESGLTTVLVVSDSYHMLRADLLARRAGLTPYRAPARTPIDISKQRWRHVLRESILFPATALLGGQ